MTKGEQARLVAWRLRVLRRAEETPRGVARTCREFGWSRKTFYKWKKRFSSKIGACTRWTSTKNFGDHYDHIFDTLVHNDLRPRLSPQAAEYWQSPPFRPGATAPGGYAEWFARAMRDAGRPID